MDSNKKPSLPNGSGWKKSTSIALAALLVFSTAVFAWTIAPQNAYAAVTITSSSDKFFGSAFNRVLITDTSLLGSPADTISVIVEARSGSTSLGTATKTVNEIGTSGTFELFITTRATTGTPANPTQATPDITRISSGASGAGNIAVNISDGDVVRITYGGTTKDLSFASTIATVSADRSTAGALNLITLTVNDPDGNNDPTAIDTFNAINASVSAKISNIEQISTAAANVFTETGQNTGIFELSLRVNATATASTAGIVTTGITLPASVSLSIEDAKVYLPTPTGATAPYNAEITTTNNPAVSVTLRNDDAVLGLQAPVTFANGIQVRVTDPDRNNDTSTEDTLAAGTVTVTVDGVTGTVNGVAFEETGENNGIFVPTLSDNRIPINIVSGASSVTATAINLNASMVASDPDITITYNDPFGANNAAKTFTFVTSLSHSSGSLTGPSKVGVTDTFELDMNEPDLNTNPATVESYVVQFTGSTANAVNFANDAGSILLRAKGSAFTLTSALTLTFIETGANTGVFKATNIDMSIISSSTTLSDGDSVSFKYTDFMQSPTTDSTATITVGKPGKAISVDRSTVPVPMPLLAATTTGGITFSAIPADTVKVTVQVTDPVANTNTGSTDTVSIPAGNIELTLATGTLNNNEVTVNDANVNVASISLTETGVSTGVFTRTVDIKAGAGFNLNELNGARIKFTYSDVSTSVTFRLNDMGVSTDKGVVANGDSFTVTISDGDRNLDPTTAEQIEFWLTPKNDDVGGPQSFIAEETGPNTGVFVETVAVGPDIRVSDTAAQDFARNIEIKVRERVATDGTTGAIKERTITVTTATGSISITPEVVGPGTKVTVTIRDFDQNANPDGTETITGSSDFVRIATDRTAVGSATPDAEESGANTGQFSFTLKMVPFSTTNPTMTPTSGDDEITVPALPGDVVAIRYTDNKDSAGNRVTVSLTFKVQSFDPEMISNIQVVAVGGGATITVTDADANVDGDVVDSIQLKIESSSDPVGFTTSALETGPNTGVFTASVTTSSQVEAGSIMARTGDNLVVRYTDTYPADYATRVKQVVDPSKDFELVLPIGAGGGGPTATSPSRPQARDLSNQPISQVLAGQQIVLATTVRNNEASSLATTVLIEVRDSSGVTVYLQFQQSTISANGEVNIGASFTPMEPDRYNVRTFVISDFLTLRILSAVQETTLNVS